MGKVRLSPLTLTMMPAWAGANTQQLSKNAATPYTTGFDILGSRKICPAGCNLKATLSNG
jgi:hypothetical protein